MRCHETRVLASPYLDSELDTKTSFVIEQHLQNCASCRAWFNGAERVEARLHASLRTGTRDAALWTHIESLVLPSESPAPKKPRRWFISSAIAASIALVATALLLLFGGRTDTLASAAAADHAKFLAGTMSAQFTDDPPSDITERTGGRLGPEAFSILPPGTSFVPEGKRLCSIDGSPIALIMGRANGHPVSIIVMDDREIDRFPAMKKRLEENGQPIACSEVGDFQVGARRVGRHIVTAVAELPRPQVEALLASIPSTK